MAMVAGSVFAEYTILKLLGTGGMGKVYLAEHPRLPRHDALKILRRSLSDDDQYRERFQREADAAATLFHPNIVGVHDRGEYRGRLWIAMDYIDGDDVEQLVHQKFPAGMPADAVLAIVSAVAEALDYAHRQNIVHRDVKPSNILVTNSSDVEQRVLLADFGIARQLSDPSGLTESNLAIGTVAYAAPEQLMASEDLSRADQYALAATAFDLLTGAPPFQGENPATVISQHLNTDPPMLSGRRPELAHLDDVICSALAKDPDDRFDSCCEFVDALTQRLGATEADRTPGAISTVIARVVRPKAPASAGESPRGFAKLTKSRIALVLGAVAAVAVAAAVVLVPRLTSDRPNAATPNQGAVTPTPSDNRPSNPSAAPPALNGTYRVDANRAGQKYNGIPNPQPPNVSTWWAVRSSCTPLECTATGVMLDDDDHRTVAKTSDGGDRLVLDFADGSWRSRPETLQFPCVGSDGTRGTQTTTQVLSLQPTMHDVLHGEMVVYVKTNECGQRGAQIWVPVVATRVGDVSTEISVPHPADALLTSSPSTQFR